MLIWYDNAPWKIIVVHKEARLGSNTTINRNLVLEQTIHYQVPANMTDELAQFDGNIITDHGRSTLTARSNREATNYLLLNLANDIITNQKNVQQAKQYYNGNTTASNDYTRGFIFEYRNAGEEQEVSK